MISINIYFRCLDMQRNQKKSTKFDESGKVIKKKKGVSCCPFYKQQNIDYLRDSALLEVQDVEDLVSTSKEIAACPYYASRKAAEDAQVILVPYNTLLHKATREANGECIFWEGKIIIQKHNFNYCLICYCKKEVFLFNFFMRYITYLTKRFD